MMRAFPEPLSSVAPVDSLPGVLLDNLRSVDHRVRPTVVL